MKIDPEKIQVVHNEPKKRFEVVIEDQVARAEYMRAANRIIFTHTEVPPALEGNGIASKLAHTGLEYAKAQQFEVMPLCPYFAGYLKRHPEYQDLLAPGFRVE